MSLQRSQAQDQGRAGVPQPPLRLGPARYVTPSWNRVGQCYDQDLEQGTCTCKAREHHPEKPCKHLVNAYLVSFVTQLEVARSCAPSLLRRALDHYADRPDIYAACLLALWEKEVNQGQPLDFADPFRAPVLQPDFADQDEPLQHESIPMTAAATGA